VSGDRGVGGDRAREASCSCGRLRATVTGDPIRVSVCHCLACQRRTGGPFGQQARFDPANVTVSGEAREYVRHADDDGEARVFRFCPGCGSTVYYTFERSPDVIVFPIGVFADPGFPAPTRSVYSDRKHEWVVLPDGIEIDEG
jgi:hypothetical protein